MARYIVQNTSTGRFLAADDDLQPFWVLSLRDALLCVLDDYQNAVQMGVEYSDIGQSFDIINLD